MTDMQTIKQELETLAPKGTLKVQMVRHTATIDLGIPNTLDGRTSNPAAPAIYAQEIPKYADFLTAHNGEVLLTNGIGGRKIIKMWFSN